MSEIKKVINDPKVEKKPEVSALELLEEDDEFEV